MGRRRVCLVFGLWTILLLEAMFGVMFNIPLVSCSGTVYIRADGQVDPSTAPILNIGNVFYTFTGNIRDSIVVERDNIVVDGAGYTLQGTGSGTGIDLSARSNVTIKNMEIKAFGWGVLLSSSLNNGISGNNVTANNGYGIVLFYSSGTTISGNNIANNNYGMDLTYSLNNGISGNNITANNCDGIDLQYSSENNISGNTITANNRDGIRFSYSSNNSICGNDITANSHIGIEIIYSSSTNNSIFGNNITANNGDGIRIDNASNNSISGNNIADNALDGVRLYSSGNNSISGNNIYNNWYGIFLLSSSGNSITGNNIADNEGGFLLRGSSGNSISENNITDNEKGIELEPGSSNNFIYHNNFLQNTNQVSNPYNSVNVWDNGYPLGGNYWTNYTGVDMKSGPNQDQLGNDGIGDTPYIIDADNRDRYPLINIWVKPKLCVEESFIESTLVETLFVQKAVLNNVVATGSLTGALNFTNFEIVNITTGPFTGKGFSKGEWEATLEGFSYKGFWAGALFQKPLERKIYLKGATSGEISGTLEGYLTETVPGNGIYDQYQATWKIGVVGTTTSATVNLNGTLAYLSDSVFPNVKLYILQTSVRGTVYGDYSGSLSAVLTHLRVANGTVYDGEGFSIISYISDLGTGEGWTYDRVMVPGIVKLNGLFTNPLFGIVSATLDETKLPRVLFVRITRVDLGLPPIADLKVRISGPRRVGAGSTIVYLIQLRNDGLKSAENVTLRVNLDYYLYFYYSNTGGGSFNSMFHEVVWHFEDVPAKTAEYVTATGVVPWGTPDGTIIEAIASVPKKEVEVYIDPTVSITAEVLEATRNSVKMVFHVSRQSESGTIYLELHVAPASEEIEPTFQYIQLGDYVKIPFEFTVETGSWERIWGWIEGLRRVYDWATTAKEGLDIWTDNNQQQEFFQCLLDKNMIGPAEYARLSREYKGFSGVRFFIPLGAGEVEVLGDAYSEATKAIFENIDPIFRARLVKDVQEYTDDMSITWEDLAKSCCKKCEDDIKTKVVGAHDPNIKYGPERYVSSGQTLNYTVEFENIGEGPAFGVYFTDTLDEDLDDSTLEIGPVLSTKNGSVIAGPGTYNPTTRTITWLVGEVGPGEGGFANFTVKVRSDAPEGTQIINFATVYFPSVPETTLTNAIVSTVGQPNIKVMGVMPSKSVIEQGDIHTINVTVANEGYLSETFKVTLYANATAIRARNITLIGRTSKSIIFLWNTTGFASGTYIMSAYASPVPDEADTEDNLYTDGIEQIKVPTPPTTLHDYNGLWHAADFTINLTATDDLSGIAETYYKINDGTTKNVSIHGQPLIATEGADNKLEYWSVDNAGNEELPHKILTGIKLDKTKPVANAGQDKKVNVGETVTFDAGASTDNVAIVSYEWEFGDGTKGTGKTTTHVYAKPGTYMVTLTVKDAAGNAATHSLTVTVVEAFPTWMAGVVIAAIAVIIGVVFAMRKRKPKA